MGITAREKVFEEIEAERKYQDKKWGGAHQDDNQQSMEDFVKYIREYSQGEGRAANYDLRTRLVKTAALAVAAIESYDRRNKS